MGLAAVYAGEAEMDIVMDTFVALANIDDAEEAVYLGLIATLAEATFQAQTSGNARNRLAERLVDANGIAIAPTVATFLTFLAGHAQQMRQEFRLYNAAATDAQRLATDGDNHAWGNLGPIH